MAEHPLLYTTEMVIRIITCTNCGKISVPFPCEHCGSTEFCKSQTRRVPVERYRKWKVGDLIWVRETFRYGIIGLGCGGHAAGIEYKNGDIMFDKRARKYAKQRQNKDKKRQHAKWRPSIHMPKWATRIWLEITGLREEAVQEIDNNWEDCLKEGVVGKDEACCDVNGLHQIVLFKFIDLWDSINAKRGICKTCKGHQIIPKWVGTPEGGDLMQSSEDCPDCDGETGYGWSQNPQVKVIEFKRITKDKDVHTKKTR